MTPTTTLEAAKAIPEDVMQAARKLINCVEFDVIGINGKGGNGGLTSDETLHAAGTLRLIMSRHERALA